MNAPLYYDSHDCEYPMGFADRTRMITEELANNGRRYPIHLIHVRTARLRELLDRPDLTPEQCDAITCDLLDYVFGDDGLVEHVRDIILPNYE